MHEIPFWQLLLPVVFLLVLITYGLILRPWWLGQQAFSLELIFFLAAIFSTTQLILNGFKWENIQQAIVAKVAKGFPAIMILFSIGVVIGTWITCGTIPMLIYYGIKLINPDFIYVIAFLVPIIFSLLTGTSWGSVGTIGTVIIGIAISVDANLGLTAGAIVGGAYFGDKMSPLSDTTNLAALSAEVNLYEHIRSMMYTTLPSAIIALVLYFVMGFIYPPASGNVDNAKAVATLSTIDSMFEFNLWLLLPPLIVLYGSIRKLATLPTLLTSCVVACTLGLVFQRFSMEDVLSSLMRGFDVEMAYWLTVDVGQIADLLNRGGLYELNEVIVFTIIALVFIGTLDVTDAMPRIVNRLFGFTKKRSSVIISSLISTTLTNAMTSSQSAASFIVGDAFNRRYDAFKIPRKVLSRSMEDYGTMVESIIPWTSTALFVTSTLGVTYQQYWHWQFLSLTNLIIAPLFALLGIGCFYKRDV